MTERSTDLPASFELGGWQYRFVRKLGQGGFGSVYEVERERDGDPQRVAVKVLRFGEGGAARGRFRDELRLLMRLDHPAFPRVYDVATVDGAEAVVMELVLGRALDFATGHTLPARVVAEVGAGVAAALDDAWNFVPPGAGEPLHVAHRDIKPGNLMVDRTGRVRVLDLGAASAGTAYRDVETRRDGGSPLTPNFCAPEVPRSMVESGTRARVAGVPAEDVYALGATLVALATGAEFTSDWRLAPRFHQAALATLAGTPLHAALAGTLAMEPGERPGMQALRQRLRELAAGLPGPGLEAWVEAGMPLGAHSGSAAEAAAPASAGAVATPVAGVAAPVAKASLPQDTPSRAGLAGASVALGVAATLGIVLLVVLVGAGVYFATREEDPPPVVAVLVPPSPSEDVAPLEVIDAPGDPGQGPVADVERPAPLPTVTPGPPRAPAPEPEQPVPLPSPGATEPREPATGQAPAAGESPATGSGGSRVEVIAEAGCEVSVDGAVTTSVALAPGPHQVACRWPDEQGGTVEKSTRVTVTEGATVRVECVPRLSRCGVKR